MIEENEPDNNGGANPSGTGEEYRDETRYSVRSLPEEGDPSVEETKSGDMPGDEPDGESFPSGERLSREELESKYRNDPRFNMLFDHGKKDGKKNKSHSVRVGGIRLTPKRILILSGFAFVVLLCLGSSLFYAFKDVGKYRGYLHAREVLDSGDYETAKELFIRVIGDDPNKEDAIEALAEIYHHFGDWGNEAFFRQRLMRLNPLNEEYSRDFLKTSFRARNFGSIYSLLNLKIMENPELPPEEGALYLISALHSNHVSNGKSFYNDRTKYNPKYFSNTEYGRYAELLLKASELNREKVRNLIPTLSEIKDEQVRFETINTLLYFLARQTDRESDEMMEKLLRESVELNEYAGAPLLANYLFSHYRFDETIKLCEEYFKTKMNAVIPILYGEACVLSGHPEKIADLSDEIGKLNGRQSKIISSYLDALNALSNGDEARLRTSLLDAGSSIETPLALLMRLQMAITIDSPKDVSQSLDKIMREQPFWNFPQRARTAALGYLLEKAKKVNILADPDLLNVCAGIASLIETPGDDVSFLRRIVLLDQFKRNLMKEEDLQNALERFPGDPVLLRIAAEYYLLQRQPARAMSYLQEYNKLDDVGDSSTVVVMHILALDQLGRKEEAEKEFRQLVEREGDSLLLYLYYDFCVENKYVDALRSLSSWLESLPKGSPNLAVLPFVRAEILLAEGKKDRALDLFEKTPSDNPRFVFHAASCLADAGRNEAAVKRLLSIRKTYQEKVQVYLRLSELYSKLGDKKNAFESARAAWQEDPALLQARYLYAKHLFDAGQYADVISVLKFPQYRASFPEEILELWSKAIRKQIKIDYDALRYDLAMENAKSLQIYFPDDQEAKDYIGKIELIRRQERRGE